ncbi:hypothetical protein KKE45_01945 [Patescibacteria group bacterium]|nr:hypothetical protein [Patescibacteria group bacterium]
MEKKLYILRCPFLDFTEGSSQCNQGITVVGKGMKIIPRVVNSCPKDANTCAIASLAKLPDNFITEVRTTIGGA